MFRVAAKEQLLINQCTGYAYKTKCNSISVEHKLERSLSKNTNRKSLNSFYISSGWTAHDINLRKIVIYATERIGVL